MHTLSGFNSTDIQQIKFAIFDYYTDSNNPDRYSNTGLRKLLYEVYRTVSASAGEFEKIGITRSAFELKEPWKTEAATRMKKFVEQGGQKHWDSLPTHIKTGVIRNHACPFIVNDTELGEFLEALAKS
tara:strand:+ start:481 stop:864 length:384 start_codon:yes stop_codon:yes gene_type:complete